MKVHFLPLSLLLLNFLKLT